jgi:hypothetical protein
MAPIRALLRSPLILRILRVCSVLMLPILATSGALLAGPLGPAPAEGQPSFVAELPFPQAPEDSALPAASVNVDAAPLELLAVSAPATDTQLVNDPVSIEPTSLPTQQAATPQPSAASQPLAPTWASSTRETALWAGPNGDTSFNTVAPSTPFRVFDQQAGRLRVFFAGDRTRWISAGEAWVDQADVSEANWPAWVRLLSSANLTSAPSSGSAIVTTLPKGTFLEVTGEARGNWASVHFLGDGRGSPIEGWLEASAAGPVPSPDLISSFALSRDLVKGGGVDWLRVPYRSQLDGTAYAQANCGPTVANMVLESFGFKIPQADLRREVLSLQPEEDCDDCGVYIENLAEVIAWRGLTIVRLRDSGSAAFHTWTQDEIRAELRAGRPVIAQVYYRRLPGRATASYWGDHFIVLTGTLGERFVFNDPIDSDGPGYSRLITAEALKLAMGESDFPYAAFAVTR